MAIEQIDFSDESELHSWVEQNISTFFGDVIYVSGNFNIYTKRNKGGKPDGFVLDLSNNTWSIVETELIKHGVWDHIAEQIVRFIVASKNPSTKKKIRNKFFQCIEDKELISNISEKLQIPQYRLIEKIENILEGEMPNIVIFIDDVNEDLEEMVEALNATTTVFRVQKYLVNGNVEYMSPDGSKSKIEVSIDDLQNIKGSHVQAVEAMGGGKITSNIGNIKFYSLDSGDKISIKYSKLYEQESLYWYGLTPTTLQKYRDQNISHLACIIGSEGVVKIPFGTLLEYIEETYTSSTPDGSIHHYHIYIKTGTKHFLFINQDKRTWDVDEYFFFYE